MKKVIFRTLGIAFILASIFLFLNNFSNITGRTILEDVDKFIGNFMVFVFIALGVLFIWLGNRKEEA